MKAKKKMKAHSKHKIARRPQAKQPRRDLNAIVENPTGAQGEGAPLPMEGEEERQFGQLKELRESEPNR